MIYYAYSVSCLCYYENWKYIWNNFLIHIIRNLSIKNPLILILVHVWFHLNQVEIHIQTKITLSSSNISHPKRGSGALNAKPYLHLVLIEYPALVSTTPLTCFLWSRQCLYKNCYCYPNISGYMSCDPYILHNLCSLWFYRCY